MKDYIKQIYQYLKNEELEKFTDICTDIIYGKIEQSEEDIIPLCDIFTHDFGELEPHVVLDITSAILLALDRGNLEKGLKNLASGLYLMYKEKEKDKRIAREEEYDFYFSNILGVFVAQYEESHMIILGKYISEKESDDFKEAMIYIVKEEGEDDNTKILVENIT